MKKLLIVMLMAMAGATVSVAQDGVATGKETTKAEIRGRQGGKGGVRRGGRGGAVKPISLADARGRIDRAIENPQVMRALMRGLSAGDQKQFLADVNKAISEMPGSVEEKSAMFLTVNSVAMTEAAPGNLKTLVAEVFATVPPESLTVIAERFAIDLFNRDAAGAGKYSDAQFTQIAAETMKAINERTAETDNGSARSAFAIIMFVRASNTSIPDLPDTLIDTLNNDDAKEMAKTEWIPSALGTDGRTQGYEPLLASADAGRRPDMEQVLVITGPQHLESVLADLTGKNTDPMAFIDTRTPVLDAVENKLVRQNPTLGGNIGQAGEAGATAGGGGQELGPQGENPRPTPENPDPEPEPPHPTPYPGQ